MDCTGDSVGYSPVAPQISYGHAALENIGTYDLRVLHGRARAAANPSLFRRADRLIARRAFGLLARLARRPYQALQPPH
jgi:hypothetical protein